MNFTKDVMEEILLHADIETIKKYCKTHKNAKVLCEDLNFWRKKYALYNFYFPLHIDKEDNYMKIFEWMIDCYEKAKMILKINAIEKNRNYYKTKGVVEVVVDHINLDNLNDLLSLNLKRDVNVIVFTLHPNGYSIKMTSLNSKKFTKIPGYKNVKEVEKILTYALTITGIVYDDLYVDFDIMNNEAFEEEEVNTEVVRTCLRRGLWEGMLIK